MVEKVFNATRGGAAGKKLADFLNDPEVKKAWEEMQRPLKTLETWHNHYQATVKKFGPLYDEAMRIAAAANAEVKERKKKLVDSKSIANFEALLKDINADVTHSSKNHMRSAKDLANEARMKPREFKRRIEVENDIAKDIKNGYNAAKRDAESSTLMREFGIRPLAVAASRMNERKNLRRHFAPKQFQR